MTEAKRPLERSLADIWIPTLGDAGARDGWKTLSPGSSYKPADTTRLDLPVTQLPQATLSGLSTLSAKDTLSGARTRGDTQPIEVKGSVGEIDLIEEVGRGGMGIVFRARQRSLARDIAVKLIRPEAQSALTKGHFLAEALVNGLLDHPNIVPVHELGTTSDGQMFLAMKLVGGTSWRDLIHPRSDAQKKIAAEYDLDRHIGVLTAVGNAVAFAHSKQIVHRDLKPENVMVGAFGEVLVMDWGIAVDVRDKPAADARTRNKSTVTAPAGTPSYMPPELAEGRGRDIGPWTDTYLLGAILCELLTGAPPHRGDSLLAVLMAASESKTPAFPAETPPGLAAICARALSREHMRRFASVAEFQTALRDYLKHRESEKIAQSAGAALDRARGGGAKTQRYGDFAEAIAGFRQALALWDGNIAARDGEQTARRAHAQAALASGDLGLAEEQARELDGGDDLRATIATARAVFEAKERTAKRSRKLLVTAAGVIVVGSVISAIWIENERGKAVTQRTRAELASTQSRRQLVGALHRQAVQAQDRGDDATSAVLFAHALEVSEATGDRDVVERIALESTLMHLPKIERVFELDGIPVSTTKDGHRLLVQGPKGFRVWDGMVGEPRGDWIANQDGAKGSIVRKLSHDRRMAWVSTNPHEIDGRVLDIEHGAWAGPAQDFEKTAALLDLADDGSALVRRSQTNFQCVAVNGKPLGPVFDFDSGDSNTFWDSMCAQISPSGDRAVFVLTWGTDTSLYRLVVVSLPDGKILSEGPGVHTPPDLPGLMMIPETQAWSPDGKTIASISEGSLSQWSAASGKAFGFSIGGQTTDWMRSASWVANDSVCGFDRDNTLRFSLIDSQYSGVELGKTEEAVDPTFVTLSVGNRTLAALGTNERELQIWTIDRPPRRVCAPISLSESIKLAAIESVERPGSQPLARVLAVGRDGLAKVALIDPAIDTELPTQVIGKRPDMHQADVLAPDGKHILFLPDEGAPLSIASIDEPKNAVALEGMSAAWSYSSKFDSVACMTPLLGLRLFEFPSGRALGPEVASIEGEAHYALEDNGRMVVAALSVQSEYLQDLHSGARLVGRNLSAFMRNISLLLDVRVTPGETCAIAGSNSEIEFLDRSNSGPRVFQIGTDIVRNTAISPDGKRIIVRTATNMIRLLSTDSGRDACPPMCDGDPSERRTRKEISSAHISPDAPFVVSTDEFGVRLWDEQTGNSIAHIRFADASEAWINKDLQLVVYCYKQVDQEFATSLVLSKLSMYEGDLAALQRSLSVSFDREWNGQAVKRLEWRDVVERGIELTPSAAGFEIRSFEKPTNDSWQINALEVGGGG